MFPLREGLQIMIKAQAEGESLEYGTCIGFPKLICTLFPVQEDGKLNIAFPRFPDS